MRCPRESCVSLGTLLGVVLVGSTSCGGGVEARASEPVVEPVLESSPWLVTLELPPSGMGPLRAQRFEKRMRESVLLDESATSLPSWSPNRTWLAHTIRSVAGIELLSMRRVEGDVWHDAQLVTPRQEPRNLIRILSWSPRSERLLFVEQRGREDASVGIATPLPDGSVSMSTLDGFLPAEGPVAAEWSATADRIALWTTAGRSYRLSIHDIGPGTNGAPGPSREVLPPAGKMFESSSAPFAPAAKISPDGRWVVAPLRGQEERLNAPRTLDAFPMDGKGAVREMKECAASEPSSEWCVPWSWHPEGATLLVVRRQKAVTATLEAWSPESGARAVIIDAEPSRWLAPHSARLLAGGPGTKRPLSIVDVRDVSRPVITPLPTTELRSFEAAFPSPDGRWLALEHVDAGTRWIEAVDLRAEPPWSHREIARLTVAPIASSAPVWSPSGAFLLVEEAAGEANRKRALRIDIETGATTSLEFELGPVPSSFRWGWQDRMAPDDRTIAIGRDRATALWPIGAPVSGAAKLADAPEWVALAWRPLDVP